MIGGVYHVHNGANSTTITLPHGAETRLSSNVPYVNHRFAFGHFAHVEADCWYHILAELVRSQYINECSFGWSVNMKINVACPASGAQKLFDIDDEKKVRFFYEKRMGASVEMDPLGEEWKGYICRITGGNDKQGFPMKQGVLTTGRVRLLLSKGHSCYRPRRTGERKRKSVRGCIVDASLSVLALVILKKGDQDIPGLTDVSIPRRLGPKRANKIRKLFNLSKQDDVRQYVVKRALPPKEGKENAKQRFKAPKIQRLITPRRLQYKRHRRALKKKRIEARNVQAAEYARMLTQISKESSDKKKELRRRRSSLRDSQSSQDKKSVSKA